VSTYCREERGSEEERPGRVAVESAPRLSPQHSDSVPGDAVRDEGSSNWLVRAFARSWPLELGVFLALAIAYNFIRAVPHGSTLDPYQHARDILQAESAIFTNLEEPLNQWMATVPVIAVAACYFYAVMHYVATPTIFFLSRRQGGWQYWRGYWALIIASGIALAFYALYPVAPPRLMPGLGIIDIMRQFSDYGWWGNAASAPRGIGDATNQFAAMPSMHFGWSLWCATQMWGFGTVIWRTLALLYPALLALVVLATGNHFLLDVLGGAACVAFGYAVMYLIRHLTRTHRAQPSRVEATA
jgi:hypothetical protein